MRRWVCIIALLAGFSADGYAYTARTRLPVPIERRLDDASDPRTQRMSHDLTRTTAWWALARWVRT